MNGKKAKKTICEVLNDKAKPKTIEGNKNEHLHLLGTALGWGILPDINARYIAYAQEDGSFDVNFGECCDDAKNNLPITKGWNFVMRVYDPKLDQLEAYKLPTPVKVK